MVSSGGTSLIIRCAGLYLRTKPSDQHRSVGASLVPTRNWLTAWVHAVLKVHYGILLFDGFPLENCDRVSCAATPTIAG